uniref:Uncharacterized protein n=1 Tax=Oryza sativa subsp. japonica TaxID=39947 RepID=Q5JJR4_ORYSJ|nr:hypothetical protein [Oryza sativa Japonica Group]
MAAVEARDPAGSGCPRTDPAAGRPPPHRIRSPPLSFHPSPHPAEGRGVGCGAAGGERGSGRRRRGVRREAGGTEAADNDNKEEEAVPPPILGILFFFRFLVFPCGRHKRPYAEIGFSRVGAPPAHENRDFPRPWVRADRPPARKNHFSRTQKSVL